VGDRARVAIKVPTIGTVTESVTADRAEPWEPVAVDDEGARVRRIVGVLGPVKRAVCEELMAGASHRAVRRRVPVHQKVYEAQVRRLRTIFVEA